MEDAESFLVLNKSFFRSDREELEEDFPKLLRDLRTHKAWRNDAEAAISHLALSIGCYSLKGFRDQVSAFKKILEMEPNAYIDPTPYIEVNQVEDVQAYFCERPVEEWCLLLYEKYFWQRGQGAKVIVEHLNKGLFQDNVHVFWISSEKFCDYHRSLPENLAQERLESLFERLKMNEVSCRHTKEAFTKEILPSLKESLSENAFLYFEYYFQALKSGWNGNWYIYDTSLFSHDLLMHYEKEMKILVEQPSQDDQKTHTDIAFVITLYYLISGEITEWSSIEEISFVQNSKVIQNFSKLVKSKEKLSLIEL